MIKINTPTPKNISSYRGKEPNIKVIYKLKNNHVNFSQDKIYFFRTSLFTEKSKDIIQKMNYSQKKINKNYVEKKEIETPPIIQESKNIIKLKKEQKCVSEDKDKDKATDKEQNDSKNITKNAINIFINYNKNKNNYNQTNNTKNQIISKSYNSLASIRKCIDNNIIVNKDKRQSENKTENKKEMQQNNESIYKKDSKIINSIKRFKLLSSINNNIVNKNKSIIRNNIGENRSIILNSFLVNANTSTRKKLLEQNKQVKILDFNNKTIYRLKSRINSKKKVENKNVVSFKNININNIQKELNCFKTKTKHSKMESFSIFNENNYILRYKLGNYHAKRYNRYDNKNSISENKKNVKKFIKNEILRNNIALLNEKDSIVLSRKDINV